METAAVKQELNDSGCVQDAASPPLKKQCVHPNGYTRQVELLDLSDDVLLIILRHCSPMELKALAFACPRLARLSLERSLWQKVDAREFPYDRRRLRWLLAYAIDKRTTELLVMGHAEQAASCEEHNKNESQKNGNSKHGSDDGEVDANGDTSGCDGPPLDWNSDEVRRNQHAYGPAFIIRNRRSGVREFRDNLQRPSISHAYSENGKEKDPNSCPNPVFTLCESILDRLKAVCSLTNLALEYCNINCKMTGLNLFPTTLKKLSLKGSRCYNLPLDKTYLFKIQDYLPELEYLDVSHCDWLEPASLLPLSKLTNLTQVYMKHCKRLTEFVAYASLAARYGFKALKEIDFQGSPVGDSEVSAFGWVQTLEVIRLSAPKQAKARTHEHKDTIEEWEKVEPDYLTKFQADYQVDGPEDSNEDIDVQKQSPMLDEHCGLGIFVCLNDIRRQQEEERRQREERRRPSDQQERPTNRDNEERDRDENDNSNSPAPKRRKLIEQNGDGTENQPSSSRQEENNGTVTFRRITPSTVTPTINSKRKCDENVNQGASTSKVEASEPSTSNSEPSTTNSEPSTSNNEPSTLNDGPSTSSDGPSTSNDGPSTSQAHDRAQNEPDNRPRFQQYVRFRQNERPVIIRRHLLENDDVGNNDENDNQNQGIPRHSVLFVSVAQQLPNVDFRNCRDHNCVAYDIRTNSPIDSTLITDSSISRFGRSDGENVNYVHLGENQLILRYRRDTGSRPDRSNLREIVANNYRFITDRSLVHLATAAPNLRFIDFRGTRVTSVGVENFLSLRPDCEVLFSPFQDDIHYDNENDE